jgi:hypothetical protein
VSQDLLDRLKPVNAAFYDHTEAAHSCLEDTRVDLLATITDWMKDRSSPSVYWLSGAAGTGKTTVAQSVAKTAKELGFLTVTFFFSRSSDDRRSYGSVIPTLAYQLGSSTLVRPRICAAVASDNDIGVRTVQTQARHLLSEVLMPLIPDSCFNLLIVLDALDESKKNEDQLYAGDLLPELLNVLQQIPFAKLFMTSRPESTIHQLFSRKAIAQNTRAVVLHRDIPKDTVQADIETYLRHELAKVKENVTANHDFPSEVDFQTLLQRTDGLFIYARTVVEYICDPYSKPDLRLSKLIQTDHSHGGGRYSRLDGLYSRILVDALELNPRTRPIIRHDLRTVLVALILAQEELDVGTLAALTHVEQHECERLLRRISAILIYDHSASEPIRLMHASFADFLSDPDRCVEVSGYAVDATEDHFQMTECCLKLLNAYLRYDICRIGDPSLFNYEIPDLKARMDKYVPIFLRYACRFWAVHWLDHLHAAGSQYRLPSGLEEFCSNHLFHWIEVLSLTETVYNVQRIMPDLIKSISVRYQHFDLLEYVN